MNGFEEEAPTNPINHYPQPSSGYAYFADVPRETRIQDIDEEEWEIVVITVATSTSTYLYLGQRMLDSATVNVWYFGDNGGFYAQIASQERTV
jgi:hypothetical protein